MGSIRLALRALGFALLGALVSARTNEHCESINIVIVISKGFLQKGSSYKPCA